jgi:hypothetical protein
MRPLISSGVEHHAVGATLKPSSVGALVALVAFVRSNHENIPKPRTLTVAAPGQAG